MKTYNLKTEYNWRGDVAELLAKHRYGAKRTEGYDFRELSRCPLKVSEWLPWLFHAAFFVEADCGSTCSASMVARACAIPAKPFTRLNCCSQ